MFHIMGTPFVNKHTQDRQKKRGRFKEMHLIPCGLLRVWLIKL